MVLNWTGPDRSIFINTGARKYSCLTTELQTERLLKTLSSIKRAIFNWTGLNMLDYLKFALIQFDQDFWLAFGLKLGLLRMPTLVIMNLFKNWLKVIGLGVEFRKKGGKHDRIKILYCSQYLVLIFCIISYIKKLVNKIIIINIFAKI